MSSSTRNATHSKPQSTLSSSDPPNNFSGLVTLAGKLQGVTQALFAFCEAGLPGETAAKEDHSALEDIGAAGNAADASDDEDESPKVSGETRCYHFSPLALRQEQELLEEYEVEDFRGLLSEAYISLSGMVELMKNIEPETNINSTVIYSLGCLLERISSLIFKIQDAYSTLELVEA